MDDDWGYPYFRKPPNDNCEPYPCCASIVLCCFLLCSFEPLQRIVNSVQHDPDLCPRIGEHHAGNAGVQRKIGKIMEHPSILWTMEQTRKTPGDSHFFSTNCLHFTSIHPSILCPQTLADTSHARRSPVRSAGASPPPGRQPPGLKRQLIELMEKGPCMLSNPL